MRKLAAYMSRSVLDTTLWLQYDYQNVIIDNWSSSFTEMHTIYWDQAYQTDNKVAVLQECSDQEWTATSK